MIKFFFEWGGILEDKYCSIALKKNYKIGERTFLTAEKKDIMNEGFLNNSKFSVLQKWLIEHFNTYLTHRFRILNLFGSGHAKREFFYTHTYFSIFLPDDRCFKCKKEMFVVHL